MLGNKETMGKNIQKYLDRLGISQLELADKIDVAPSSLNYWIKGKTYPRIDKIERMARVFKCTKTDLIEDEEEVFHTYELTNEEYAVLMAYRNASQDTKRMVMTLLMAMNNNANNQFNGISMRKVQNGDGAT